MKTDNNRQVRREECHHTTKVIVTNSNDIKNSCDKLGQKPEFEKLTSDQKLRIACCYPVETSIREEIIHKPETNISETYYELQIKISKDYVSDIISFCKEIVQAADNSTLSPEQIMEIISSHSFTTSFEEHLQALKDDKKFQKFISDLTTCKARQ